MNKTFFLLPMIFCISSMAQTKLVELPESTLISRLSDRTQSQRLVETESEVGYVALEIREPLETARLTSGGFAIKISEKCFIRNIISSSTRPIELPSVGKKLTIPSFQPIINGRFAPGPNITLFLKLGQRDEHHVLQCNDEQFSQEHNRTIGNFNVAMSSKAKLISYAISPESIEKATPIQFYRTDDVTRTAGEKLKVQFTQELKPIPNLHVRRLYGEFLHTGIGLETTPVYYRNNSCHITTGTWGAKDQDDIMRESTPVEKFDLYEAHSVHLKEWFQSDYSVFDPYTLTLILRRTNGKGPDTLYIVCKRNFIDVSIAELEIKLGNRASFLRNAQSFQEAKDLRRRYQFEKLQDSARQSIRNIWNSIKR